MPGFTRAACATSRIDRRSQPRVASRRRPAASRAWSRLREGRGIGLLYNCIITRAARMALPDALERARAQLARLALRPDCSVRVIHELAELEILAGDVQAAFARLQTLGTRSDGDTELLLARAEAAAG